MEVQTVEAASSKSNSSESELEDVEDITGEQDTEDERVITSEKDVCHIETQVGYEPIAEIVSPTETKVDSELIREWDALPVVRALAPITLQGRIQEMALVDSGAVRSCVSKEWIERHQLMKIVGKGARVQISLAQRGRATTVEERVVLHVNFGKGIKLRAVFIVVPELARSIILGTDFMAKAGVALSMEYRLMTFTHHPGVVIPLTEVGAIEAKGKVGEILLVLARDRLVKPFSQEQVWGMIPPKERWAVGKEMLIKNCEAFYSQTGITVQGMTGKANETGILPMVLWNGGKREHLLKRGTVIVLGVIQDKVPVIPTGMVWTPQEGIHRQEDSAGSPSTSPTEVVVTPRVGKGWRHLGAGRWVEVATIRGGKLAKSPRSNREVLGEPTLAVIEEEPTTPKTPQEREDELRTSLGAELRTREGACTFEEVLTLMEDMGDPTLSEEL